MQWRRTGFIPFIMMALLAVFAQGVVVSPAGAVTQSGPPIRLRSRVFTPQAGFPATARAQLTAQADIMRAERAHVLIQFDQHPADVQRAHLAQAGIRLLRYAPERAWFASIPLTLVKRPILPPGVRAIATIQPADKRSPRLMHLQPPLRVQVATYPDVEAQALADLVRAVGGEVVNIAPAFHHLLAVLPNAQALAALAEADIVFWLDAWPGPFAPKNDGSRDATKTTQVHAAGYHGNPVSAPGSIVIGVWDCGWIESAHPGFAGRLTIGDPASTDTGCGAPAGVNDHATHVGGTAAGSGANSPAGRDLRGHADQAQVLSYDVDNASQEVGQAVQAYGLDISQNSWGPDPGNCDTTVLGVYDQTAADFDAIARGVFTKTVNVVFANGNEQSYCPDGWRTSSGGAMGKNVIAVGATNSDDKTMTDFSSFGPTEDGRVNPTVVAPGCEAGDESAIWSTLPGQTYGDSGWCGTSMAAPAVSGILGLMLEAHNQTYGTDPLPAALRAALIHTAEDLGNPGPDYRFGYGHVDALAAVHLITATTGVSQSVFILTGAIAHGQIQTHTLLHGGGLLKCTLAWDDEPATLPASLTLVNDLDLTLLSPANTVHLPWVLDKDNPANNATTGVNTVDTVEQVVVAGAASGAWRVRVVGSNVPQGPQTYALICPFNLPAPMLNPAVFLPIAMK